MYSTVYMLLVSAVALPACLAVPVESNATLSQIQSPKVRTPQGTPGTPLSNPTTHEEAWTHQEETEDERTQTPTTSQTRKGRATLPPTKKMPRPCPGCFSVIGDPPITRVGR